LLIHSGAALRSGEIVILNLDIETFSTVPIKHGTHRYAEEAEVLLVQTAFDDDPVHVEDVSGEGAWEAYAPKLQAMVDRADTVRCHKSDFERTVLRHCGVYIPVEKIEDTMVVALQHSLPGALGTLCDVLGVPQDKAKDKDGKKLIHLFTKPRPKNVKLRRATRETHPDEWQRFIEYARLDVVAMRAISQRLPRWNCVPHERHLWLLDQEVNDGGVSVDLELARSAIRAFERASGTLAAAASELTDGAVASTTQRQRLINFLADECGLEVSDMTKSNVAKLLGGDLDPIARSLLENRKAAAATAPAKYGALLGAVSKDGRLRGTLQFCGASRTGRDAGRIFQPQNIKRPDASAADIEVFISALKADCEDIIYE
jgi:DNA polymerase